MSDTADDSEYLSASETAGDENSQTDVETKSKETLTPQTEKLAPLATKFKNFLRIFRFSIESFLYFFLQMDVLARPTKFEIFVKRRLWSRLENRFERSISTENIFQFSLTNISSFSGRNRSRILEYFQ